MSLKEQFDDYRQKKEARDFFRQNNDTVLNGLDIIKAILIGLVVATICGYLLIVVITALDVNFSIFELMIGYIVAMALKKLIGKPSTALACIAVGSYFVGIALGFTIYAVGTLSSLGVPILETFFPIFFQVLQATFFSDVLTTLFYIMGAAVAYFSAKD